MNIVKMNLMVAGFLLVLPFARAQAQCQPDFPGQILNACGNPDLLQLESDAVTTYLQLHHIPQSESSIIYQYGRADLRNAIRGLMFDDLIRIINEDPSTRTPHEQALFNWFNSLVQQQQQSQWNTEVADINSWEANPCTWRPDPTVASAYGLNYDAGEWCSGNPLVTAFSPGAAPAPSPDYFAAAALQKTFGAAVTNADIPYGSATEESVQQEGYLMYGYAAAPAVGLSAASALGLYQYFLNNPLGSKYTTAIWNLGNDAQGAIDDIMEADGLRFKGQYGPLSSEATDAVEAEQAGLEEASTELLSGPAVDFAAGPAAIVLIAVEIGVEAGFDFIDYNDAVNNLNAIKNNPPNQSLSDLATDSTGTGMYKLMTTFTAQTLPDTPSTQPLPEHRNGVDAWFVLQPPSPSGTTTETQTLTYTDLAGTQWNIQTYEGFFLQSGTLTDGTVTNSISPTLTITDPQGVTWAVDWTGGTFLLTKLKPADTDTVCPADPATGGVSNATNFESCSSYVAFNFTLQDGTIVSLGQAPVFTSSSIAGFPAGQSFSMNITASGIPAPSIGFTGGPQQGFSASGGQSGSATLEGAAFLPAGTYTIPLGANNGTGTATQNLTLVLGTNAQIISPTLFTETRGVAATLTIRAAGNPVPSISLGPDFVLPPGYAFHDNGNGTASISGTEPGGGCIQFGGSFFCTPSYPFGGTVFAKNLINTAQQSLTINSVTSPDPVLPYPPTGVTTSFTSGIENTFVITSTGATTPVTMTNNLDGSSPPLPPWMHFTDNGNGTATYFGTPPPADTPYDVDTSIWAQAAGSESENSTIGYPVTFHVSTDPVFTDTGNRLYTICDVNAPCVLFVDTNMATGTLSLSGDVPDGLSLGAPYPNQGQLHFQTATGGAYAIAVNATNGYGSATQIYTIYVRQAPGFPTVTSGNNLDIWLMAKVPANYSVPTTGYPHDIGFTTPGGTQILPPMQLSLETPNGFIETLPSGLTLTSQTSAGIPTGTALIGGTPAEGSPSGDALTLKANNGITSYLNINLHVRIPGDVNNDGEVNCTDVDAIKAALGSYVGQPNYNVLADINNDGAVNVADLALVARYLPRGCPIQ